MTRRNGRILLAGAVSVIIGVHAAGGQAYVPTGLRVENATALRQAPDTAGALITGLLRSEIVYPDTAGDLEGQWLRVWHATQNSAGESSYRSGWVRIDDLAACGPCGCGQPCRTRLVNRSAMIAALVLPETAPAKELPATPYVPFNGDGNWMLERALPYSVGRSGITISVPAGFVTDFASVPQFLWAALPPHGQYMLPAVVHDYLYWEQMCSKAQADNLLAIAMKEQHVDGWKQKVVYKAVNERGGDAYRDNWAEKSAGRIRIVPSQDRPIPAATTWAQYRQHLESTLKRRGDPKRIAPPPRFCALGDSRDIP
jgi:hypothetical protein